MVTFAYNGYELGKLLADEGLLPKECANIEILTPADDIMQIRYTVNVTGEDLPKIARAFATLAEAKR